LCAVLQCVPPRTRRVMGGFWPRWSFSWLSTYPSLHSLPSTWTVFLPVVFYFSSAASSCIRFDSPAQSLFPRSGRSPPVSLSPLARAAEDVSFRLPLDLSACVSRSLNPFFPNRAYETPGRRFLRNLLFPRFLHRATTYNDSHSWPF